MRKRKTKSSSFLQPATGACVIEQRHDTPLTPGRNASSLGSASEDTSTFVVWTERNNTYRKEDGRVMLAEKPTFLPPPIRQWYPAGKRMMTHQMTFSDLKLDPELNMLPDGAITMGGPNKEAGLMFSEDDTSFTFKIHMILHMFRACAASSMLKLKEGSQLIFFIPQHGGAIARFNSDGALREPDEWEGMETDTEFTEGSLLLKRLADALRAKNIAVFLETDCGAMQPVANTYGIALSFWQDKEFTS